MTGRQAPERPPKSEISAQRPKNPPSEKSAIDVSQRDARTEFRRSLLQPTIEHASLNVMAYRARYGELSRHIVDLSDLGILPIVTKEEILQDPDSFRDPTIAVAATQYTGGTTQRRLALQRGREELTYIERFFELVNESTDKSA